jgi:hypothetical protein
MQIGKARINTLKADTFVRVYTNTLTSAATSVTISSLLGNTDEIYIIRAKFVNNAAGAATYAVHPNNDTGTNYGYQYIAGVDTAITAARSTSTGLTIGYNDATNKVCYSECTIYAKSGYVRTAIVHTGRSITGTTITDLYGLGESWNNSADEITSLVIDSSSADGLGIGTRIDIYKLVRKA